MEGEGEQRNNDQAAGFDAESDERGYSAEAEGILESMERAMKFWDKSSGKNVITLEEICRCETLVVNHETMAKTIKSQYHELERMHKKLKMTGSISKRIVREKAREMMFNVLKCEGRVDDFLSTISQDKDAAAEILGQNLLKVFDDVLSRTSQRVRTNARNLKESQGDAQSNSYIPNSEIAMLMEQAQSLGLRTSYFTLENFATERAIVASLRRQIQGKLKRRELLKMASKEGSPRSAMKVARNEEHLTICDSETFQKRLQILKEKVMKCNRRNKSPGRFLQSFPPSPSKRFSPSNRRSLLESTPLNSDSKNFPDKQNSQNFTLRLHAINPKSDNQLSGLKNSTASIDIFKNNGGSHHPGYSNFKKGEKKKKVYRALYHSSNSESIKEVPLVCCDSGNIIGISLVEKLSKSSCNESAHQISEQKINLSGGNGGGGGGGVSTKISGNVLVKNDSDPSKNLISTNDSSRRSRKHQRQVELDKASDSSSMSLLKNKEKKVTWVDGQASELSDAWLVDENQLMDVDDDDGDYRSTLLLTSDIDISEPDIKYSPKEEDSRDQCFDFKLRELARKTWSPALAFGSIIAVFICAGALSLTKTGFVDAGTPPNNEKIASWIGSKKNIWMN